MLNSETRGFISRFARAHRARTVVLVGLLVLAGMAEGFGVLTLLPLLELSFSDRGATSALTEALAAALQSVGLEPRLEVLLLFVISGMVLKAGFHLLAMKQVGYTMARVATDLRLELIRALMDTRWAYFVSQPSGRFANAIGSEVNRASSAYRATCKLAATGVQALVYATVAFLVSWRVALFAIAAGGLIIAILGRLVDHSRRAGRSQTQLMNALTARLTDTLQGIKPIKAMARQGHLRPLLERQTQGINQAQQRQVLAAEAVRAAQEPLLVLFLAGALYFILTLGTQSFAAVMVIGFVFYRLAGRIALMQVEYQSIAVGESAYWSLRRSIDEAVVQRETVGSSGRTPTLVNAIMLDRVSFSYGSAPVLKQVSMAIPHGQIVAIVGASGAGKTTLVDIITGLYEPTGGAVLIDGVPLQELDSTRWRHMIGYVPQETLLFHDSLYNNITLGDVAISELAVQQALVKAGAGEFVRQLPEGLDTVLGERGSRLSGGQRQRISIARALVKAPQLLILDEATASLDPPTELAICETLRQLRGDVTMISISHQPALTRAADLIYRLEEGLLRKIELPEPSRIEAAS